MKTVSLDDVSARRAELLDGLAKGETFTVTDAGQEIAALTPSRPAAPPPPAGSALALIADLIGIIDAPSDSSDKKKRLEGFGLDGPARRALRKLPQDT